MKIDVISVTGCQLALTPDEVMRKMGAEWREPRGMAPLTTQERQQYDANYRARETKVYDPAGPTSMTASFPAQLTGKARRSLANNPPVYGRTEYVLVTAGRKETSYAASGTHSELASKGAFTKRRHRWDPVQKKVVWDWAS
jgi:hypothetical protein